MWCYVRKNNVQTISKTLGTIYPKDNIITHTHFNKLLIFKKVFHVSLTIALFKSQSDIAFYKK